MTCCIYYETPVFLRTEHRKWFLIYFICCLKCLFVVFDLLIAYPNPYLNQDGLLFSISDVEV